MKKLIFKQILSEKILISLESSVSAIDIVAGCFDLGSKITIGKTVFTLINIVNSAYEVTFWCESFIEYEP